MGKDYVTPPYTEAQMKIAENLMRQIDYSIEKEIEDGKTKDEATEITKNKLIGMIKIEIPK